MKNDSIIQLWEDYCSKNSSAPKTYDAWAFGNSLEMANELAALVLEGKKTATSSLYKLFELGNEVFPYAGLHNIILDGSGKAIVIIETTEVKIIPFDEVSAEFAYLEGEGDRSLKYWQDVHEIFFKRELEGTGMEFDRKMQVVCEKFKLVYKR